MAAAKKISVDTAVGAVLSGLDSIFTLVEELKNSTDSVFIFQTPLSLRSG